MLTQRMHRLRDSAVRIGACRDVTIISSAGRVQLLRETQRCKRLRSVKRGVQARFATLRSGKHAPLYRSLIRIVTDASLEAGQQQTEQLWARESDELAAGSLSLYLGCMFAGKSTLLIDTLSQAEASVAL